MILNYTNYILNREGLSDWNIVYSADNYCWFQSKTIQLSFDVTPAMFLHEVAHALYQEPEGEHKNHFHGGGWADKYTYLINKYMVLKDYA